MGKVKVILAVLALVIVVIAVAVTFLVQNLDALVKQAIETYGSEAAGTAVRVQSVKIEIREGRGGLQGLKVANPAGFSGQDIFSLGEIVVDLDTGSLTSELPVVEEVRVGRTGFHYEVNAKGKTNLGVLQENLKRAAGSSQKEKSAADSQGEPVRVKVKRLVISGGEGTLDLSSVGAKSVTAKIPGITLTDIGGKDGITPKGLAQVVLTALVKELEKSAARQGVEKLVREKLGEATGELEQKLETKIDEKLGEGAGESLKKMFGK